MRGSDEYAHEGAREGAREPSPGENETMLTPLEAKLRELASGPRVDSEPVWEYLDRCEQVENNERKQEKERHAAEERAWLGESMTADSGEKEAAHTDDGASARAGAPSAETKDGAADEAREEGYPLLSSLKPSPGIGIGWYSQPGRTDPRMLLGFGLGLDRGRAVRHLGSFLYDALHTPFLPASLLASNVGATIEVRISGQSIGLGISEREWRARERVLEQEALERVEDQATSGLSLSAPGDGRKSADDTTSLQGRWQLGWRGNEHARMNREIRVANMCNEYRLNEQTNKRLKRGHTQRRMGAENRDGKHVPSSPASRREPRSDANVEDAAWSFWSQASLAKRKLWGTDVYTDDSDILAMCVHAGWIEGPRIPHVPEWLAGGGTSGVSRAWLDLGKQLDEAPVQDSPQHTETPAGTATCDLSVVLRIAPKLILYKGCHRGGIQSRSWGNTHDGVSLVVESVELRAPGYASARGRRSAKKRINHMAALQQEVCGDLRSIASVADKRPRHEEAQPDRSFWEISGTKTQ